MNLSCNIVKDLMPLYKEDLCSEETKTLVEGHIETCSSCKQTFHEMNENVFEVNEIKDAEIDTAAINVLKRLNYKMKKVNFLIGGLSFGISLIMLYTVTSFTQLNHYFAFTFNLMVLGLPVYLIVRTGILGSKIKGKVKQPYELFWLKEVALAIFIAYSVPIIIVLLTPIFTDHFMDHWPLRSRVNLIPFNGVIAYIRHPEHFNTDIIVRNTLGKMLAFVPFGLLTPLIWKNIRLKNTVLIFTSIIIAFQILRLLKGGIVDVDTVILNVIGFLLGYNIIRLIKNKFENKC